MIRKTIFIAGFVGALALTAGVMFKLLHFPGGDQLFIAGFLTLFMGFIPLLVLDRYKVIREQAFQDRLKVFAGTSASVLVGMAGLFKILHFPGADVLLVVGAVLFALGFLPLFFLSLYHK